MTTVEAEAQQPKDPLSPTWPSVPLRDVIAEAQPGFASGQRDPNGVIQLRMNNVDTQGHMLWDSFIRVPTTADQLQRFALTPGDVLFNNTNSTELVGKSALFLAHEEPIVFSNHFTRLRTKPDACTPEFLAAWLMQQWNAKTFARLCNRWVGQSAVKADKLLGLAIPLPPLPEQRRIAAILRSRLLAVEAARKSAIGQLRAINMLPAALLRDAFNGKL